MLYGRSTKDSQRGGRAREENLSKLTGQKTVAGVEAFARKVQAPVVSQTCSPSSVANLSRTSSTRRS